MSSLEIAQAEDITLVENVPQQVSQSNVYVDLRPQLESVSDFTPVRQC
jgi:hypothetical protein